MWGLGCRVWGERFVFPAFRGQGWAEIGTRLEQVLKGSQHV